MPGRRRLISERQSPPSTDTRLLARLASVCRTSRQTPPRDETGARWADPIRRPQSRAEASVARGLLLAPMIKATERELQNAQLTGVPQAVVADAGYWNERTMD